MPKTPTDYSRTIIYKICCNDVNITDCYVGHTTDLIKRKNRHKTNCSNSNNTHYNIYVYQFIRDNGGWDNWSVVPIEEYKCENVNQAKIRERYWIEELKSSLNKYIPSRTDKEYREENKEQIKKYREENKENIIKTMKQYYHNNKNKIDDYKKEWYQINMERLKNYKKEWYENNKDIILEKRKEYYENNRDKIKCECSSEVCKKNLQIHYKSKKHQNYLNTINQ